MSNKGRFPKKNELSLWRRFVEGVTPLKSTNNTPSDKPPKSISNGRESNKKDNDVLLDLTAGQHPVSNSKRNKLNKYNKFCVLDGKTYDRLRKGKIKFEAVLDLHGMTRDQAHKALINFVTNAYDHNRRCVLVITGKGKRSVVKGGVLRSSLPLWLSTKPLDDIVLTYVPAKYKDGGEGAFYLYLKRLKIR